LKNLSKSSQALPYLQLCPLNGYYQQKTARHFLSPWHCREGASGGELGSISLQISSPKHKALHSLIKELGLDRVAKLTPCKNKLYVRIGPVRVRDVNMGRS